MKIEQFVKEEVDLLKEFMVWWNRNNMIAPVNYPDDAEIGEWGEQFQSWCLRKLSGDESL